MALIDNLVGFWNLAESSGNALDASGGGLTLTETSGTIDAGTISGKGARDFETADTEYFTRSTSAALNRGSGDLSFAAWINAESLPAVALIAQKGWGLSPTTDGEWFLWINSGNARIEVSDGLGSTSGNQWNAAAISTSTVYYIAWGWATSGPNLWLSVNGATPVVRADVPVQSTTSTGEFSMGGDSTYGYTFDGLISCAGLWKRDIRSDLTTLYNSGTPMNYSDMSGGAAAAAQNLLTLTGVGI